jgi:hypothetical protein
MAYKLLDFSDIYTAIANELQVSTSDATSLIRIKRAINMAYIDEVLPFKNWWWLRKSSAVTHRNYFANSTVSVTPGSTTITFASAPGASDGDSGTLLNWNFSISGKNEVYKITAHTALASSATIDRPFNNELDTAAEYKCWPDFIALPTDLRETFEVWHDHMRTPMVAKGLQDFRKISIESQKYEGRPEYYSTDDFYDPSSGTGELESDRYRVLRVWPSIYSSKTLIRFDYIAEAGALESDGDEPLMPIEDRIVLYYGALKILWASMNRNPEEAMRNQQLFDRKLAQMAGKIQDSLDKPRIEPEANYLIARRGNRMGARGAGAFGGGGSSTTSPTYAQDITINGATITGNVTVNSGITIDGVDVSVLNTSVSTLSSDLTTHIADTSTHGITSTIVGISETQTLTNKSIDADTNTVTNIKNADIKAAAAIAKSKLAAGTASRVEVTDSSGLLTESAITSTELTYLDDAEALTSVALTDNATTTAYSAAVASFDSIFLMYSMKRGSSNKESGFIMVASDGTNVAVANSNASVGTLGVTFSGDIDSGNVRLRAALTSTGTGITFQYKAVKWLA